MSQPELSICIATLNRGAYIGQTLDSIIQQNIPSVEIVIVDGGSTDNTAEIVQAVAKKCPQVKYVRLTVKGGLDQDYDRAVQEASGKYCWLFSDDDVQIQGAITKVLEVIQSEPSLIIVNSQIRDFNLAGVLQERRLKIVDDQRYESDQLSKLLSDIAFFLSFIGCVIIRRDLWMARDRESYYGTAFVHVGVIFQKPLPAHTIVLAVPLIQIRYGNASWIKREFDIWYFRWPKLLHGFSAISQTVKDKLCPPDAWRNPKIWMIHHARGTFGWKQYHDLVAPQLTSPWDKLLAKMIICIPVPLANRLVSLYFAIRRPENILDLYELKELRQKPAL